MPSDTRERIVAVARDLVHGASLAEVSIDDVCRAAGVHKGSLYHFFPSKDALGAAVLELNWAMMSAVLEEAFTDDVAPLARIDRFVEAFARMLGLMRQKMGTTPGCPLGNLAAELAAHGGEVRVRLVRALRDWTRYFADAISEAKGRGEIEPALDPDAAATRVIAHLQGLALLAKAYDDPDLVLRLKDDLPLLLLNPAR
ncbi:TetR/AcrR family transcriptional regulator [Planomonospora parontospora]|uniref:TetR/AcrR family transcriptional regulator n=1 Tax=Planomonospora parontospora TaxID=58119 RepID=UPI001670A640|nr:TetR/AcrR family transcriptional regulator [Planomonospora parontospora]GGL58754.1 TetR family transcriptional regulator [Planomonospora parontospora subsp. antibiotica]